MRNRRQETKRLNLFAGKQSEWSARLRPERSISRGVAASARSRALPAAPRINERKFVCAGNSQSTSHFPPTPNSGLVCGTLRGSDVECFVMRMVVGRRSRGARRLRPLTVATAVRRRGPLTGRLLHPARLRIPAPLQFLGVHLVRCASSSSKSFSPGEKLLNAWKWQQSSRAVEDTLCCHTTCEMTCGSIGLDSLIEMTRVSFWADLKL